MSEAELHLIRPRLTAGLRHKAAKGELCQGLPGNPRHICYFWPPPERVGALSSRRPPE